MALLEIPVWTIPPDWTEPVVEGVEWLTSVLASITGVEQRMSIRQSPRRYIEYTVRAIGEWRTWFDALMTTQDQIDFYFPLWYEQGKLASNASSGGSTFVVHGIRTELNAADVVMLRGVRPWEYELAEVTSVTTSGGNSTFHLGANLASTWPKSTTTVYPVCVAQLNDQPSYNRITRNIVEASVRFDLKQINDWTLSPTLPTYRSFSVIDIKTNEGDNQTGSYFRVNSTLDNTIGIPLRRDIGGISFPGSKSTNFILGRAALDDMRSFLYYMRGKANAAWVINPTDDFVLTHGLLSADTGIVVRRSGFADLNGPQTSRQDIRILLTDGTSLYRRITGAIVNGGGLTETLSIDSAIGQDIPRNEVVRISFMAIGRLDQDLVELSHTTDADGVCNVSLAVKLVPDLRDADDWDPPALQLTNFGDCGPTVPGNLWVRINDGLWNATSGANPSFGFFGFDISALGGHGGPFYPLGQVDANFDAPDDRKITFNFGATVFKYDMPHRAQAWDDTGDTTINPADANGNLLLSDSNRSMSRRLPSSSAGPGDNDNAARCTTSTDTQTGLRYFEVYTDPAHIVRAWSAGVATSFAYLEDLSSGGAGGSHDPDKATLGSSAGTINNVISGFPDLAPGDTICVCIFT